MKKISLLVLLCVILTIGGVYAAWIYSGNQIGSQDEQFLNKMGGLDYSGNSGSYTFTDNSLDFAIEPNNQDDKITTIVWGHGSMTLVFTPSADINETMLEKALTATITVICSNDTLGEYKGEQIYNLDTDFKIELNADSWTKHDNENDGFVDYYTYSIDAAKIEDAISINQFKLPTEDDYNDFKVEAEKPVFKVVVAPAA